MASLERKATLAEIVAKSTVLIDGEGRDNYEHYVARGVARLELEEPVKALEDLQTAETLHPGWPKVSTVKEGFLLKQGAVNTGWKRRYFTLKAGALFYYKSPTDAQRTGMGVVLDCVQVPERESRRAHTFAVESVGRRYVLQAETADEMVAWMNELLQCRGCVQPSTQVFPVRVADRPLDVVPNEEAKALRGYFAADAPDQCYICRVGIDQQQSKRRCELCGRRTCKACSVLRKLPQFDQDKPVRGCVLCLVIAFRADELRAAGTDNSGDVMDRWVQSARDCNQLQAKVQALEETVAGLHNNLEAMAEGWSSVIRDTLYHTLLTEEMRDYYRDSLREVLDALPAQVDGVDSFELLGFELPSCKEEVPVVTMESFDAIRGSIWKLSMPANSATIEIQVTGRKVLKYVAKVRLFNIKIDGIVQLRFAPNILLAFRQEPQISFDMESKIKLGKMPIALTESLKAVFTRLVQSSIRKQMMDPNYLDITALMAEDLVIPTSPSAPLTTQPHVCGECGRPYVKAIKAPPTSASAPVSPTGTPSAAKFALARPVKAEAIPNLALEDSEHSSATTPALSRKSTTSVGSSSKTAITKKSKSDKSDKSDKSLVDAVPPPDDLDRALRKLSVAIEPGAGGPADEALEGGQTAKSSKDRKDCLVQ